MPNGRHAAMQLAAAVHSFEPCLYAHTTYVLPLIVSHGHSQSVIVTHGHSLSLTASHCQSLSVIVSHCQSLSVIVSHCQSLSVTVSHCQSLSVTVSHGKSICAFQRSPHDGAFERIAWHRVHQHPVSHNTTPDYWALTHPLTLQTAVRVHANPYSHNTLLNGC